MSEQEKKRQRIYDLLNTEAKPQKFSKIIGASLLPPSSPDLNPFDYTIWYFLENKTKETSYPNVVRLGLLLRRNGIKFLKDLFGRHADTIIEKNSSHIVMVPKPAVSNELFCDY